MEAREGEDRLGQNAKGDGNEKEIGEEAGWGHEVEVTGAKWK